MLEFIGAEILTERVVKAQVANKKKNDVHILYLKSNAFRCNNFLQKVESLPFKRYTSRSHQSKDQEGVCEDEDDIREDNTSGS